MLIVRIGIRAMLRQLQNLLLITLLISMCAACSTLWFQQAKNQSAISSATLPGEEIWPGGVSSFLFGANDTQEWSTSNVETDPAIQQALKNAHFTLMRTFFFDRSLADNHPTSDMEIEQRLATVENSGMTCLGVLANIFNVSFARHVVTLAGARCRLYEFGNEDDYNGISIASYLKQWNTVIPQLRQINPQARFIGPVTYNDQGNKGFMSAFLNGVKQSGVLPDAISFHWYPCDEDSEATCLAKASSYAQATQNVRTMVENVLGKDLPIGISEWNYDPGNPPPAYGDDADFMAKFSTAAINAMIQAHVAFACQFDIGSYSGYGRLDMFNVQNGQPKPQFYALKNLLQQHAPASITSQVSASSTPLTQPGTTSGWVPATTNTGELISRGRPVYCAADDAGAGGTQAIVDGHYGNWSFWRSSLTALPSWCAIHLDVSATQVLLVWNSDYSLDYISNTSMAPQDYTISTSANSTNGADGTWQTVTTVTGNRARVREHLLPFAGQSWVKVTVTRGQPQASQPFVTIDEIDIYNVSSSLNDTFIFSGDSITAMAYNRFDEDQPAFAEDVHAAFPHLFPAMIDAGLGGWDSDGAVQNIDTWLKLNPDIHYWLLGWGTNDAFDQVSQAHFRANMQVLIQKIQQAGHIPVLAQIPYARPVNGNAVAMDQEIRALNAVIVQLTTADQLIPGPNLYTLTQAHAATYLLPDGIHPTPAGAIAMNHAWFLALEEAVSM